MNIVLLLIVFLDGDFFDDRLGSAILELELLGTWRLVNNRFDLPEFLRCYGQYMMNDVA